jgi:integrase
MSIEDYQAAISIRPVRGESEPRGRHLSAGDLHRLFEACNGPSHPRQHQDSTARRQRDDAFLALAYSCGLRRSEAVAIDQGDLDLVIGELRVRRGKGRKPRQLILPPSVLPPLKSGRLASGGGSAGSPQPRRCLADLPGARSPGRDPGAGHRTICGGPGSGSARPRCRPGHRAKDGRARFGIDDRAVRSARSRDPEAGSTLLDVPYIAPED